ncbi:proline-rich receptor-like protein kinase PERK10 [Selaginella moellendorffii]|uniref:proline-rich receptor-like protein kinase PERK10 n=1 Tax=Selaginella moellendorffii TaxID=88036 RepID=UPI000D1C454D|nr:proline-rich receptor-like protein kinase PERK10 [Selaginella moellendorffii]|eukprot:XP_024530027.1 proline-rich receptor-like protein kinase PERK10 [Selaginella moellendorffii]
MAKRKEESWESRIRTLHTELAAIRERFSLPEKKPRIEAAPEEKAAILDQEPAAPIEELARGEDERQEDFPDDVIFLSPGKLYREIVDLDPDSPLSSPRTCPDVIILPAPPVVAKKSSPAPSDRSGSSRAPPDVIILPAPPVVAKKSSPAPSDRSGSSRPPPVAVDHGFRASPADQSSPAAPEGSLAAALPVRRQAPPDQSSLDGIEAIPRDQSSPAPPKAIVGDQSAAAPRNRSPRGLLANQSPRTDQTSRDPQSSPAPAEATPVDSPVRRTRSFRAPPPPPAVDQSSRARRRCSDKDVNLLPSSPPPPPLVRFSSADQSSRDQGLEALPRPRRIKQPPMEDLSSPASSAKPVSSPHPKNKSTLHGFVSVFLPVLKDVPDWVSGPYQEFKDDSIRLCNKCLSLCEWIYFLTKEDRELCAACVKEEGCCESSNTFLREGVVQYLSALDSAASALITAPPSLAIEEESQSKSDLADEERKTRTLRLMRRLINNGYEEDASSTVTLGSFVQSYNALNHAKISNKLAALALDLLGFACDRSTGLVQGLKSYGLRVLAQQMLGGLQRGLI